MRDGRRREPQSTHALRQQNPSPVQHRTEATRSETTTQAAISGRRRDGRLPRRCTARSWPCSRARHACDCTRPERAHETAGTQARERAKRTPDERASARTQIRHREPTSNGKDNVQQGSGNTDQKEEAENLGRSTTDAPVCNNAQQRFVSARASQREGSEAAKEDKQASRDHVASEQAHRRQWRRSHSKRPKCILWARGKPSIVFAPRS